MSSRQIVARATSLAASTGLLALAIAGALSVSYVVQENFPPAPPPITSIEPEPVTPPPPIPHTNPPPQPHVVEISTLAATVSTIAATPLPIPDLVGFIVGPPGPPNITDPRWLREPRDLARYYPARAQNMGVEGSATLDCAVDVTGALHCTVVAETPSGWNFGAAALRISQDYRMAPAMRGDQAVEGHYRMSIPFEIPR